MWGCAPGICSPGCSWILGSAHLLGTVSQNLHSAHLDPTDCGICSPGSAHLDLLTWWDLCLQDLLTWMLPDPRVTGTQIPQSSCCPPRSFPKFLVSPSPFPAVSPHWALTLTSFGGPLVLLGVTCAPWGVKKGLRGLTGVFRGYEDIEEFFGLEGVQRGFYGI